MSTHDERAHDGQLTNGKGHDGESVSPAAKADLLVEDVERIRGNLDRLVGELDRRRHRAFDLGLQLRRYRLPLLIGAASVLAAGGGGIALAVHRRRQRQRLSARAQRLQRALARMVERPDRVAPPERGIAGKLLMAAAGAAAAVLARKLTERAWGVARAVASTPIESRPALP